MIRPTVFNLLYHITPFSDSDAWRRNVSQLLRRIHVFNGRRVVGVATGAGGVPLIPIEDVKSVFGNERIDHWVLSDQCDRQQKHSPTFYAMMDFVKSSDPHQATFYAHAKGVSCPGSNTITSWRNEMYHYCLDDVSNVAKLLTDYVCAGTHKFTTPMRSQMQLTEAQRECPWHYSGCFWWFRNDAVFTQDWTVVPMNGYAVEFYLPMLFSSPKAACLFNENPAWPYHASAHQDWPDPPDWENWLRPNLKPPITTRHLIYHLAPMAHNDVWIRNLADLFSHLDLFNGRRIMGIASGLELRNPAPIIEMVKRRGFETFVVDNDPWLREAKTFPELLNLVRDDSPSSALFYAHSKGVSLGLPQIPPGPNTVSPVRNPGVGDSAIHRWRRSMYFYNLARADDCLSLLEKRSCVGSFRCTPRSATRTEFPGGEFRHGLVNLHRWHYAGSFFWARCDSLFSHPRWQEMANIRHGWTTEAFPGNLFSMPESGCVESDTWLPRLEEHFGPCGQDNPGWEVIAREWTELAS